MSRPRRLSLSVKVGLLLFAVVGGALALVYAAVVPRLESRLVDAKMEELRVAAPGVSRQLREQPDLVRLQDTVEDLAQGLNLRIAVFNRLTDDQLYIVADSTQTFSGAIARDPVARAAAYEGQLQTGRIKRGDRDLAEVATPIPGTDAVVLLSASLQDALSNVQTIRRSVIAAGLASLAVSWLAGYLVAWAFTRRIKRLEGAAERLAAGDFATPVWDPRGDEVGQLAEAFDAMRARLDALDRARSEFIANASHELRTPIFSLGGFLELLDDAELDEATRADFLAEMRGQVERMTRLATDLLDLSRLDAGQLEVERRPVELADCARVVCEEFRALAEAGERELTLGRTDGAEAIADELRVLQIARILVENALRHTPVGTHVEVRTGTKDGRVYLAVADTGPGVPSGEEDQLFERFYRAGGGKASGSGLGLAIASELAQRMNGRVEVRSAPGDTVFTLRLPAGPVEKTRENGAAEEAVLTGTTDSAGT